MVNFSTCLQKRRTARNWVILRFVGKQTASFTAILIVNRNHPFSQSVPKFVTPYIAHLPFLQPHYLTIHKSTNYLKFRTTTQFKVNKFFALTLKVEQHYWSLLLLLPFHLLVCTVAVNLCLLTHYTPPLMAPADHGIFPTRFPQ